MSKSVTVNLRILDKDYVLSCPEEEREMLVASAKYFNQKIQEVREGGKVFSSERVVVVSALTIVHEFLQYKQQHVQTFSENGADEHMIRLQEKIEVALNQFRQ